MGRSMIRTALILAALALTACVHNKHRTDEAKAYTDAQAMALEKQKPIFELEAQEGQQITLGGVKALRVYAPRDTAIRALPQQQSGIWRLGEKLVDGGLKYFGFKFASDTLQSVFEHSGDHSVTNIVDSYNTRGDEISDSILVDGGINGPGAGIGNDFVDDHVDVGGDGSAAGDGNVIANGDANFNDGRQGSDDSVDDHSGGSCAGGAGGETPGGDSSCPGGAGG